MTSHIRKKASAEDCATPRKNSRFEERANFCASPTSEHTLGSGQTSGPDKATGFEEEGTTYVHQQPALNSPTPDKQLSGIQVIRSKLKTLDNRPGVYRMLDRDGNTLYVGKARALKQRVSSYGNFSGHSKRIQRMIQATASLITVGTDTETEALLLEANMIKKLKPRYNVFLRDDKSFPYIALHDSHSYPQLSKHRGSLKKGDRYFGPFATVGAVNRSLKLLQKVFLLRTCSDSYFRNRSRPCLLYQIKRCCAPCVGAVSESEYGKLVRGAVEFLHGRSNRLQQQLAEEMNRASAALEYERAAEYRDRIQALAAVQTHQHINPASISEADVIAMHLQADQACVQVFFYRAGHNWGNRAFFPHIVGDASESEILQHFLGQFYVNLAPAKFLLLDREIDNTTLIENALSEREGRAIRILVPKRGEKRKLVANASKNAAETLARRLEERASHAMHLSKLAEIFELAALPKRIEIFDNSHIQGSYAVGAMVVAGQDGYEKSAYRKYNIRADNFTEGDDFGMMREVLRRRFARLVKSKDIVDEQADHQWPDLLLIDGGSGQLSAAHEALAEFDVPEIPIVAIAKGKDRNAGREVFYRKGVPPLSLPERDPTLHYLQRLRDEAHRFAIGAHRQRRGAKVGANSLDEIEQVGARRKRSLLHRFGSAKAVSRAGIEDLAATEGISRALAKRIYDYFHGGSQSDA